MSDRATKVKVRTKLEDIAGVPDTTPVVREATDNLATFLDTAGKAIEQLRVASDADTTGQAFVAVLTNRALFEFASIRSNMVNWSKQQAGLPIDGADPKVTVDYMRLAREELLREAGFAVLTVNTKNQPVTKRKEGIDVGAYSRLTSVISRVAAVALWAYLDGYKMRVVKDEKTSATCATIAAKLFNKEATGERVMSVADGSPLTKTDKLARKALAFKSGTGTQSAEDGIKAVVNGAPISVIISRLNDYLLDMHYRLHKGGADVTFDRLPKEVQEGLAMTCEALYSFGGSPVIASDPAAKPISWEDKAKAA